ncbi:MAG: cystathionine beta-lyase [Deltaproteobacteria bacterium]|nr:cystathionine beta-lyase [Deltaproteobacteria bacterium]MBM4346848.1 cystathionine beta-lyase [Deltaproteobacteria bacterium]
MDKEKEGSDQNQTSNATLFVELGRNFNSDICTANLPVYHASTVLFESLAHAQAQLDASERGELGASHYGTIGTPTTFALRDALARIEGAGHSCRAAIMPSGLMAITTLLLAYLKPGDHLLVTDSVYGPTRVFCKGLLSRLGINTTWYDPTITPDKLETLIQPATRMIFLESPGSYTFEIQDVPGICAIARRHKVMTAIDNAWGSPVFAKPFDWGVDASVLPLTKYWSGHADVLMGAVVVREENWLPLWRTSRELGMSVGGDDAALILRGMRTLDVRMKRHQQNALEIARWLERRPEVGAVLHPALPGHPQHALWKRDFRGSSGLFSFELKTDPEKKSPTSKQIAALCEGRRYFGIGYSWGGFESLIFPARIGSLRTVTPWQGGPLIRVHIGLEDPADLIADLEAGFSAMARAT